MRNEVRLRMKGRQATDGLHGGWWPRSRSPKVEFPELVLVMSSWVGPVGRVSYHPDDWDAPGHTVTIEGWPVELVGSTALQPHTVRVVGTHQRERGLLVVPHDVSGEVARSVLTSAAAPGVLASAEEMLTSNGVRLGRHEAAQPDALL